MSLDALFQKPVSLWQSKIDEAYSVYSNFIKLKKIEMSMNDYIIEYEHLYQKNDSTFELLDDTTSVKIIIIEINIG